MVYNLAQCPFSVLTNSKICRNKKTKEMKKKLENNNKTKRGAKSKISMHSLFI